MFCPSQNQESQPRFQGENFAKNKIVYNQMEKLGEKHGCTPAQLALAWILHQGDDVAPIPGEYCISRDRRSLLYPARHCHVKLRVSRSDI